VGLYKYHYIVNFRKTLGGILKLIKIATLGLTFMNLLWSQPLIFEDYFLDKTLRIDYYQTGTADQEIISLDELIIEPIWAGTRTHLIDPFDYGAHRVEVFDVASEQLIFSRGYSSLFGEWQTTDEALDGYFRTFSASVMIPLPINPVRVDIYSRDRLFELQKVFSRKIDPDSNFVRHDGPRITMKRYALIENGSPSNKVDLLVLSEGYTRKEMRKFKKDLKHLISILFQESPFKENQDQFNVWYLKLASEESGIDNPRKFQFKRSALNVSYNAFDVDRYVLAFDNKRIRDIAANAPYDQLYILINSEKYGGGGIYNLYSTCYSHELRPENAWWPEYVFVHEFGHAFGGLADEYYSSQVAYNEFYPLGVEPWEPNITALLNSDSVKWSESLAPGIEVPTPWDKSAYDEIPYQDAQVRFNFLRNEPNWGKVGVYRGAGYASEGLYRPCLDCRMFSKSKTGFCPVCQKAIQEMIQYYTE
jgi:hypothetical protein